MNNKDFGFWCTSYKEKVATLKMIEQVREFHSDHPFHLISDDGEDFSKIARKFDCLYSRNPNRIGCHSAGRNRGTSEGIWTLFHRMKESVLNELSGVEWIIYMEPDVEVFREIQFMPDYALAGGPRGPCLKPALQSFLENKFPEIEVGNKGFARTWTGSGGSAIHVETFLDVLGSTSFEEWSEVSEIDPRAKDHGDIGITVLFQNKGVRTGGWKERGYTQMKKMGYEGRRKEAYPEYSAIMAKSYALAHAQKMYYRDPWTPELEALVS